jgi:hypothetical protein
MNIIDPNISKAQIRQNQNLFKFMLENNSLLALALVYEPNDPNGTVKLTKDQGISKVTVINLMRKIALDLENDTVKINEYR